MAEIDDLYSALEKADATGNAGDAREIAGMIRQMEGAGSAAPKADARPAERNAQGQVIEDLDRSRPGEALLTNAAEALSFGAAGPIAAYIAAGASRLTGNPISYKQARANQIAHQEALNRENPGMALTGTIAGSLVGGLGIAKAVKAVAPRVVAAVTPQAGDSVAKVAGRLAAGGAAAGAGSNLAETGVDVAERELTGVDTVSKNPISDAIVAGGIGGVAGPVVGGAVGLARRGASKVRDMVTGNELGGGWRASIAQVMDMKQQGVLAELARDNPAAGVAFRQAAEEGAEALPSQVRDQVRRTVGAPRSQPEMEMATAQPGNQFRASRAMDNTTFLTQGDIQALRRPDFIAATRDLPPELRSRVAGALQGSDELSVNELDLLRRHVASWGDAGPANKGPAQELQTRLTDIAERTSPGYRAEIIDATRSGKLREEGFTAGRNLDDNTGVMGGAIRQGEELAGYGEGVARRIWDGAGRGPRGAASAADEVASGRNMQDALQSAYGGQADELVEGARALAKGQRSLENVAPGRVGASPSAAEEARGVADIGAAVAATTAGGPASMAHRIARLLPGGVSERVAGRLADDLVSTDPRRVAQAVANLRRGGMDNRAIAEVQSLAARVAGDRSDIRQERRVR